MLHGFAISGMLLDRGSTDGLTVVLKSLPPESEYVWKGNDVVLKEHGLLYLRSPHIHLFCLSLAEVT